MTCLNCHHQAIFNVDGLPVLDFSGRLMCTERGTVGADMHQAERAMADETTQELEQRLNKQIDEIGGQVQAADEMYRTKLNRRIYVLIEIEMRLRQGGKPIAVLDAAVRTALDARDVTPPLVERLLDTAEALARTHASSLVEEREQANQSPSASTADRAIADEWPG